MTDMQHYIADDDWLVLIDGRPVTTPVPGEVVVVLASEALATIADAERRGRNAGYNAGYVDGARDARASAFREAIAAVEDIGRRGDIPADSALSALRRMLGEV